MIFIGWYPLACRYVRMGESVWAVNGAAYLSWNPSITKCSRRRWHRGPHRA